jgi:PAS domain S-box-containing protein
MNNLLKLLLLITLSINIYSKELEKISLQLQWKHQFEFAGFYAAKEKGFYKDAGFDINFIEYQNNINQIEKVLNGSTTYGIWGAGIIASALNGKEIVLLANYFKRSPLVFIAQPDIRLPSDFKNKKIMLSNMELKDAGFLNMFSKFNIDINNIEKISPSYDINDFIDKKVDIYSAFLTNEPFFLQQKGIPYNIIDPNNFGVEQYDVNLFTSKKYAKNNPRKIRDFIEASNKGWKYALENKEEIVELILDKYNTQLKSKESLLFEANEVEKVMFPKIYPIGSVDPQKIRKMAEVFVQFSDNKYDIDLKKFILDDYFKKNIDFTKEELNFIRSNKVKCVTNTTWSPFNLLDNNNKVSGIAIDYWKLITQKTGLDSKCEIIENWPDVLDAIKNNKADITLSTTRTVDRENYAHFTKPYVSFPIAIATRNDFGYISDIKLLKDIQIAVGKNTSAHKLLLKNIPNMNLIETSSIDESLELLSTGKVDATAEILPVLAYKMNQYGYTNLKIAGKSSFNFDVMMMINDDKKILTSIINKAIDKLTLKDKQDIYNKWISVKYEKGFDYELFIKIIVVFSLLLIFILYRHKVVLKHKEELNIKNQELEKSKKELYESNKRLTIAAKASFDLLYEWDVKTGNLTWYGDVDQFLGFEQNEISQNIQSWLGLIHPDDIKKFSDVIEEHKTSNSSTEYEYRIKQKNGKYQYWKDHALPILDSQNKPIKWIGVCTDQTLAKKNEQHIIEQSKLASMGEMIGNIAHQWRQPLSLISTISTSYKLKKEMNIEIDLNNLIDDMNNININTQYLSKTIDDFRNFIKGNAKIEKFNLYETTEQFLHLIDSSRKDNNIKIILDLDKDIIVNGHPNELIQCFINIFNNAKDAFKDGNSNNKYLFITQYNKDKKTIIKFKDNAGGIKEEILPRIFEPYFTTKHQYHGTGLGLSMSYNLIIKSMNGNITAQNKHYEFENTSYSGAEFIISIPLNKTLN